MASVDLGRRNEDVSSSRAPVNVVTIAQARIILGQAELETAHSFEQAPGSYRSGRQSTLAGGAPSDVNAS